jgi:hypothetical protein
LQALLPRAIIALRNLIRHAMKIIGLAHRHLVYMVYARIFGFNVTDTFEKPFPHASDVAHAPSADIPPA